MWGLLHTQRSPRLQGREGDGVRDGHSRPSGVDEACYIQLPRVDEGDAAAQQAVHHTQTDHPKMASASSEHIPLLLDDGQGLMEPQLPDVTDDITKAPRRFEQVPLVGAPAADDWEPTDALKDSISWAIDHSDAEGLRRALAGLSPEQAEKALTTGKWEYGGSAIHHAARWCSDLAVFEVLLHNRRHLLNLKNKHSQGQLVLWRSLSNYGEVDVVEAMVRVDPQLLNIKDEDGKTPLDRALYRKEVVGAMLAAAGELTMELLGEDEEELSHVLKDPELLPKAVPYAKYGLGHDFERAAGWTEALTANFCSDTDEALFRNSLKGKEREWFALLESAEPLTVVTQGNPQQNFPPFWLVAFVLLHIESIRGDSMIESAVMGQSVWLWGAVLTGSGFVIQEAFQGIRLKAAYWADSWNIIDMSSSLAIAAFIAIHFLGYSSEAEVSSGIVIALLFALRLLQTASLQPTVGPLILAVVRMFSDISIFLCLYVYILLVFAGVFTVLSSDEDHQYFGSFPKATLTLFFAGQGDFNEALSNAIESHDTLGAVLLFTYVILSSIILASTYAAIEETQAAQYQLLRIRVLNKYLTMPRHERLPPPFNLIAVVVSEPLRYLANLISEQRREQSALCRIAFWSMKALTVDGLLLVVAFTPVTIYRLLTERLPQVIRERDFGLVLCVPLAILLMPVLLLCQYAQRGLFSSDATETDTDSPEMADDMREAGIKFKDRIDKWIEAADHHNSNFPDVMAALESMERQHDARHSQIEKRLTEMEARMEEHIKEIKAKLK
ncbi:unnamed protein product [Vitrella brassicaformis CCMP3155]|uniref:Ion transport domain-containing protein n=1 Tax=Vitrella brassicaformis (strain CCMP3155) TaxID=1169540 RepID=A0A0G4EFE9_VITBC|nr:unnamed protein product [Vitrella brassicaformis CCMP3155]|eukprot:CEL94711.1 unnamed protein product [Vitrella brassicaformis CCMP3155]